MPKPADIRTLGTALPPLTFKIEEDQKNVREPAVQYYLNHYQINFSESLPGVRHGFGRLDMGGFSIATHYWLPEFPDATIFVQHGYLDHVGLFSHLIRFSLQNNYAVVAYDLPGMGLSSGPRASIASFDSYYRVFKRVMQLAKRQLPTPWHCIAQSAGATAVIQHLTTDPATPLDRVVLLAPLVRSMGWGRDKWLYRLGRLFLKTIPRVFTSNSHDQEFLKFLKYSDPLQSRRLSVKWVGAMNQWIKGFKKLPVCKKPVLIIQGQDDKTVNWRFNLSRLKKKFPAARVKLIPKARHHLAAESAPFRAQVFASSKMWLEGGRKKTSTQLEVKHETAM